MMRSQGIKGPSYRFFHGNSKQILSMGIKGPIQHLSHHEVLPKVLPHIYAWNKLYGMNSLSWRGPQAQLTVTEVNLIKEILNNRDGMFTKRKPDVFMQKLIGNGLLTTDGEKWSRLRKLSNHAFHSDSLKGMIPAMIASVEMMLDRWRLNEEKEIEISKELKLLTSEVISRTAFGSSYLEGQRLCDMLMQLGVMIYKNKYRVRIPGIGKLVKSEDERTSDRIEEEIRKCLMKMIKKREETAILKNQLDWFGDDFLGLLVKANHENDIAKKISIDDLIDECKTFYVAGQETTATSLTWTLFFLAIHTDWQQKAREEILEFIGTNNPCPQTLPKLKIMSMIINEALRLYPPAVVMFRRGKGQVRLGEIVISENVNIEIPVIALHHNSKTWGEDVHMFKPDRFAEGIPKATNNNVAAYIPFGMGARSCVGSNFAITETKIAVSMILQRYRLVLSPNYVHSPYIFLTIVPKHGLQILLQPL
ncbi:cytochrome P450 CYP749A22-like [Euphorbia lathyris]|uniref:cytochrome P450 CYP749A22-like n=1 Tax=Euphorbia lathyris TaxID=212925 RepID=UPI00331415C0